MNHICDGIGGRMRNIIGGVNRFDLVPTAHICPNITAGCTGIIVSTASDVGECMQYS